MDQNETILLDANYSHITEADESLRFTEQNAYLVKEGEVYIYITKLEKGKPGILKFVGEMSKGNVIPTLAYRDADYFRWRFVLKAKGSEATIEVLPQGVTGPLRERFAKRFVEKYYAEERNYERALLDYYTKEELKGKVVSDLEEHNERDLPKKTSNLFVRLFSKNNEVRFQESDPQVKAVMYACRALKISDVDFKKVKQICQKDSDIPAIVKAANLICREIVLEPNWFQGDCGVVIGTMGKTTVVCAPEWFGYSMYDPISGKKTGLTRELAVQIAPKAYVVERNLPTHALKLKDLLRFGMKEMGKTDVVAILTLGLVTTLIGILLPTLNQKVYDEYIPTVDKAGLAQLCVVIGAFMIGNLFFSIVKSVAEFRMQSRIGYRIQDAAYQRVFKLPESFFHKIDSADLAQRLMSIGGVINSCVSSVVITGVSTLFSILYLVRMFRYESKLTWISLLMLVIYFALLTVLSFLCLRYQKIQAEDQGKASSKLYQYLNGIAKIRMAGAEKRAIYDYMVPFTEIQFTEIRENRISTLSAVLSAASSFIFSMVLYYVMVKSKVSISMGAFIGFNTAFGSFSGAFEQLIGRILGIYQLKPTIDRFKPIFETPCEDSDDSELPGELTGSISVNQVSFAYSEGGRKVLEDLSLEIKAGEYLGIVGSSGCGKSTLLKLLLGFEKPQTGQILYDNNDLNALNKYALRQHLGVVLQNGKLIAGSIHENITITAPKATMKEVSRVIEQVGLKEDIDQMSMGVHTVLSENSGTISGGQQQRILIARAIIGKPSILIFDEATSALDNVTQATVSENLDKMHITRIVVAHRLSTIKNCDRIIVLDQGKIAEEGNYDQLMEKRGLFYQLAIRQIAE